MMTVDGFNVFAADDGTRYDLRQPNARARSRSSCSKIPWLTAGTVSQPRKSRLAVG